MKLTAIFDQWLIGDGDYPPLSVDDQVNLAFRMQPTISNLALEVEDTTEAERFDYQGLADYSFNATLLRKYIQPSRVTLGIFEACGFRFYLEHRDIAILQEGNRYRGSGRLLLDEYLWTENLERYTDPPDLFYNLHVRRIQRIRIPEKFFHRSTVGIGMPAYLTWQDIEEDAVSEIYTMKEEKVYDCFYLVDFDSDGLETASIPRTFIL